MIIADALLLYSNYLSRVTKYDWFGSHTSSNDHIRSSQVISGHHRSPQVKTGMWEFTSSTWLIRLWRHSNQRINHHTFAEWLDVYTYYEVMWHYDPLSDLRWPHVTFLVTRPNTWTVTYQSTRNDVMRLLVVVFLPSDLNLWPLTWPVVTWCDLR